VNTGTQSTDRRLRFLPRVLKGSKASASAASNLLKRNTTNVETLRSVESLVTEFDGIDERVSE